MFERRLKVLLGIIFAIAAVLVVRAFQLQVVQYDRWQVRADESMRKSVLLGTRRGEIQDVKGRPLAYDAACRDAAVDYRAIVRDAEWIKAQARARLKARAEPRGSAAAGAGKPTGQRLREEIDQVNADIDFMWQALARVSGKGPDEIEEIKAAIVRRVQLRRRYVWYARYQRALEEHESREQQQEQGPSPWYQRWLTDERTDAPQLDDFKITVGEEVTSHVILRDIGDDTYAELYKLAKADRCPGLDLRASTHRVYAAPGNLVACHLLGRLSLVSKDDMAADPNLGGDELRRYEPNDEIGRGGLEGLVEPLLRGSKGKMERRLGKDQDWVEVVKAQPGKDVRCTIDLDLQVEILRAFEQVKVGAGTTEEEVRRNLHGAAVVIDVPSGEVRALVSYPIYDANRVDADYARLARDDVDKPLMNRATMAQLEPGSAVKPIIGSVAATEGIVRIEEGIECTGYFRYRDARGAYHPWPTGRCWTQSMFGHAHHDVPSDAPHQGRYGNLPGWLCLADALERSCNVYFETVADRMGLAGVSTALGRFGLGRPTGLGIPEAPGRVPNPAKVPASTAKMVTWFGGIGQGQVTATPIQMANVAATLARDGVWARPRLLVDGTMPARGSDPSSDRVNLRLFPSALAAVREGMINVVNGPAGTGREQHRADFEVAGKTGSAQSGKYSVPVRDEAGKVVRNPDGTAKRIVYEPGAFPWYQGVGPKGEPQTHLAHAWFIGYAPARQPRVAFCVMVEYGGSGGKVAGAIVRELLDSCVAHGYLPSSARRDTKVVQGN